MKYNTKKLQQEITAAGIDLGDGGGCNSSGEVWLADGTHIQERADVAAIITTHNPTEIAEPTVEEQLAALKLVVEMLMDEV